MARRDAPSPERLARAGVAPNHPARRHSLYSAAARLSRAIAHPHCAAWARADPPHVAATANAQSGQSAHCHRAACWKSSPPNAPLRTIDNRHMQLRRAGADRCSHIPTLLPSKTIPARVTRELQRSGEQIWRNGDGHYAATRRKTRLALVPPKPKEFDSTTLTGRLRARCGTRSMAVATDGLSRLMVGGTT